MLFSPSPQHFLLIGMHIKKARAAKQLFASAAWVIRELALLLRQCTS
jgi:hypothetical protein